MRRTSPIALVVAALLGTAAGFLIDQVLTGTGRATFTPSASLVFLLLGLAVLLIALALPVRRALRGRAERPLDPFRAVRVAMLAKASSLLGAIVGGVALGLALFLITRPVPPAVGSITAVVATLLGAVVVVGAALVAENMCIIRKDDDDESPEPGASVAPD